MTTTDTPSDSEIFWGINYRLYSERALYWSDDPREREEWSRENANRALSDFRKKGGMFPDGS